MKQLNFFYSIFLLLIAVSCAHHRSGRYVLESGEWVFKRSQAGFLESGIHLGPVDEEAYNFRADGRFIWPVPSSKKVSSHFGKRNGRHHDGIDIPAITGTHIVASAGGTVTVASWLKGYGKIIVLKHSGGYHTVYAHNSRHFVKRGQKVSQGEVIAKVGSTGRSSGSHLHFEIRRKNKVRNPKFYLARLRK